MQGNQKDLGCNNFSYVAKTAGRKRKQLKADIKIEGKEVSSSHGYQYLMIHSFRILIQNNTKSNQDESFCISILDINPNMNLDSF
jgi:hypothetical protein